MTTVIWNSRDRPKNPDLQHKKEKDMTDCNQIQDAYNTAKQQRDSMPRSPIKYCEDNSDNLQEYKACLRGLAVQRQDLDGQIAVLGNGIALCQALIGTWAFTVVGVAEISGQFVGQFILTSGDADSQTWSGTLSLQPEPNSPETSSISGTYSSASGIRMRRRISSGNELYIGTVDLSARPPTMQGTMYIEYDPGTVGIDPFFDWSAHK